MRAAWWLVHGCYQTQYPARALHEYALAVACAGFTYLFKGTFQPIWLGSGNFLILGTNKTGENPRFFMSVRLHVRLLVAPHVRLPPLTLFFHHVQD